MHKPLNFVVAVGITILAVSARADETVVSSVFLPGASISQEVTYSPSKAEYEQFRDQVLARLRKGDPKAFSNPAAGPWMRAETTAMIGLEFKGAGAASGRKHLRQISAAEEALFRFQEESKRKP